MWNLILIYYDVVVDQLIVCGGVGMHHMHACIRNQQGSGTVMSICRAASQTGQAYTALVMMVQCKFDYSIV